MEVRDPILLADWYFSVSDGGDKIYSTRTGNFVARKDPDLVAWLKHSEPTEVKDRAEIYRRLLAMPVLADRLRESLGVEAPRPRDPMEQLTDLLREHPEVVDRLREQISEKK